MSRPFSGNVDFEGWIWKESRHVKKWRQRWGVLDGTWFYTYKEERNYNSPTEALNLREFNKLTNLGETEKGHCFVVSSATKEFNLSVFREAEFEGRV